MTAEDAQGEALAFQESQVPETDESRGRFNGLKQGLAVWVWAVLIALVVAGVGLVAGSKYNILARLNSFPRLPVDEGTLSTAGIVALAAIVVASLVGALLGGLAGMRFHQAVDQTGLGR